MKVILCRRCFTVRKSGSNMGKKSAKRTMQISARYRHLTCCQEGLAIAIRWENTDCATCWKYTGSWNKSKKPSLFPPCNFQPVLGWPVWPNCAPSCELYRYTYMCRQQLYGKRTTYQNSKLHCTLYMLRTFYATHILSVLKKYLLFNYVSSWSWSRDSGPNFKDP